MKDPILEFERIDKNINELFGGLGSKVRQAFSAKESNTDQPQDIIQRSQELQQKYAEKYGKSQRVYSKGKIMSFPIKRLLSQPSGIVSVFVEILTGSQLQLYNEFVDDVKSGLFLTNLKRLNRLAIHGVLDEDDAEEARELIDYINQFKKTISANIVDKTGNPDVDNQNKLWQRILELSNADKIEIPEEFKKVVKNTQQQPAQQIVQQTTQQPAQPTQRASVLQTIPVKKRIPESLILRKTVIECLKNC